MEESTSGGEEGMGNGLFLFLGNGAHCDPLI
jgi:hypothetical protein